MLLILRSLLAGVSTTTRHPPAMLEISLYIIAYILVGSALLVFIVIALKRVVMKLKSVISKQRHAQLQALEMCQLMAVPAEDVPVPPTVTYIDFKHTESECES